MEERRPERTEINDRRAPDLDAELRGSTAALADAIAQRYRAEEALANLQVEHINAMKRIAALEDELRTKQETRSIDDDAIVAPSGSTEDPNPVGAADGKPVVDDDPVVDSALTARIARLRSAVEEAVEHGPDWDELAEIDPDSSAPEVEPSLHEAKREPSLRERLSSAAAARHLPGIQSGDL